MIAAAWVGLAAGLLAGRLPARGERWWLACFSAVAAILYGWLLNLWFWPTLTGLPEPISFVPGAEAIINVQHWVLFNLTTSMGYDLPRAVLTFAALAWLGPRVLASLRRASRRAAFDARPEFAEVP